MERFNIDRTAAIDLEIQWREEFSKRLPLSLFRFSSKANQIIKVEEDCVHKIINSKYNFILNQILSC